MSQGSTFPKYELAKHNPWYFMAYAKHGNVHPKLVQKILKYLFLCVTISLSNKVQELGYSPLAPYRRDESPRVYLIGSWWVLFIKYNQLRCLLS